MVLLAVRCVNFARMIRRSESVGYVVEIVMLKFSLPVLILEEMILNCCRPILN